MRFVIKITDRGLVNYVGEGGTYNVNRERYVVLTERESDAKRYKTYGIAKRAYETLRQTCVNMEGDVKFVRVDETVRDRHIF